MSTLLSLILAYRYAALLPLAFLEGPLLAIAVGFLIFQGHLSLLPSFVILLFADVVRDVLSYYLGRKGYDKIARTRFGHRIHSIENLWQRHTIRAVLLSKWAYGLTFPLLISAGLARVQFWKYLTASIVVTGTQYAVLIALGYFFGQSYDAISEYVFAVQVSVAVIVVFLLGLFFVFSQVKKTMLPEA